MSWIQFGFHCSELRGWSEQMVHAHIFVICFLHVLLLCNCSLLFLSLLQLKKTKKNNLWSLIFFLTVFLSGCRSVPQHHLLQPALRENQCHARGGLSSSSSSRPPWRYPQDAQWLWHPGWGAGPQAVRLAASLCLLFKYALSMQATEKPCFAFFWMVYYTGKKKITPILLIICALIVPHYNIVVIQKSKTGCFSCLFAFYCFHWGVSTGSIHLF